MILITLSFRYTLIIQIKTMQVYIQFLVKSTDDSKNVSRLGSDEVYILDGRNSLQNQIIIAERLSLGKSYKVSGFKIIKAKRFTDDGVVLYSKDFNN